MPRSTLGKRTRSLTALICTFLFTTFAQAIGIGDLIGVEDVVNGGNNFKWQRVELPGTTCSDGSQYKFWVHDNAISTNLVVLYEGGGACWDHGTCSGQRGHLGAANPDGIPNNYIYQTKAKYVSPLVNGADPGLPLIRNKNNIVTKGWDVAYMPYCTGDVHIGNNVATYVDPTGTQPPFNYQHTGYNNSTKALDFLAEQFPNINKMLITGFSAGGVASGTIYQEARERLKPQKGYMLNDSGPLFPAPNGNFNSKQMHKTVIRAWKLGTIRNAFPADFRFWNLGKIVGSLARKYPQDQFAYTGFSSDYNFSRFSYETFFSGSTQGSMLAMWREDQANLIAEMNKYANYSYFIPWSRPINDSHCTTILTFMGTSICPTMRKRKWYEYISWNPTQEWTCAKGFTPISSFLSVWVNNDRVVRMVEPYNRYNEQDATMRVVAPLINGAL
jgi:hypothetical protein